MTEMTHNEIVAQDDEHLENIIVTSDSDYEVETALQELDKREITKIENEAAEEVKEEGE
jgi:hypothetical protein